MDVMTEPQASLTMSRRSRFGMLSMLYLAAWYAVSLALQFWLAFSQFWTLGVSWWRLPPGRWLPGASLMVAFMVSAAVAAAIQSVRGRRVSLVVVCTIAVYGLVFLGLIIAKADYSRAITFTMFAMAVLTVPAPQLIGPSRWPRILALSALVALAVAGPALTDLVHELKTNQKLGDFAKSGLIGTGYYRSSLIRTGYYNLEMVTYPGPKSRVYGGGALARIGGRYLRLTGDGRLYVFELSEQAKNGPNFTELPYQVPINGEAISAAAGRPWGVAQRPWGYAIPQASEGTELGEVLSTEFFRTYGLLVQESGPDVRIFVSHAYWNVTGECWVERVSTLEANGDALLHGEAHADWKTLYETKPCLPIRGDHRRHGIPFVGFFGGGRMQFLDPQTLLLTVGDFGFDGLSSIDVVSQDPAFSYGKTIAIDIADGRSSIFTFGHRNPEGLYVDHSGNAWSTEHGPRGGDKLNLLVRGANYGWPYATYGTDYGSFSWLLNKPESEWRKQGYQDPVFTWLPAVGISNLLVVEGELFQRWRGDLLIGSLKELTLFRVHLKENRVAYVEPITIGSRIRDVIEGHDGRIILSTDDDTLIMLRPQQAITGESLVAEKCAGCHQTSLDGFNRIGPNLSGVLGRRVASLAGYPDYSSCLRRLGGVWNPDRLDAFLKMPRAICPGTTMDFEGVTSGAERAAIIQYLGAETN
jgi:cytochrome c2